MEFIDDSNFNNYVEKYKKLPLNEKKEIVSNQIKELIAVLDTLNQKHGKNSKMLFNREILDLNKQDSTEDDFVEAMFVYSYSIKELFASLIEELEK